MNHRDYCRIQRWLNLAIGNTRTNLKMNETLKIFMWDIWKCKKLFELKSKMTKIVKESHRQYSRFIFLVRNFLRTFVSLSSNFFWDIVEIYLVFRSTRFSFTKNVHKLVFRCFIGMGWACSCVFLFDHPQKNYSHINPLFVGINLEHVYPILEKRNIGLLLTWNISCKAKKMEQLIFCCNGME